MRKIVTIKDCMKTFEGDGIPITRALSIRSSSSEERILSIAKSPSSAKEIALAIDLGSLALRPLKILSISISFIIIFLLSIFIVLITSYMKGL